MLLLSVPGKVRAGRQVLGSFQTGRSLRLRVPVNQLIDGSQVGQQQPVQLILVILAPRRLLA